MNTIAGLALLLTFLNVIIAAIGVTFIVFTLFEYWKLKQIRDKMDEIKADLEKQNYLAQKALHRVIASYSTDDNEKKLSLLQSAEHIYPKAFNLYNAIGYVYLEKGEIDRAIEAFHEAIKLHPEDEAGYCDLAYAYHKKGNADLSNEYIQKAKKINPEVTIWF